MSSNMSGKHKRSESHRGPGIVDTVQVGICLSPESVAWLKSQPGSMSSNIRKILEEELGEFEVKNLTPTVPASKGYRCQSCQWYATTIDEEGYCIGKCTWKTRRGRNISRATDNGTLTGAEIVARNIARLGAPEWCLMHENGEAPHVAPES